MSVLLSNVIKGNSYNEFQNGVAGLIEKNKDATFYGVASGRSMEGVGIFDGDLLIIDRSVDVKQGDVIVCAYNGVFVCKIADLKNNLLLSASEEYPPVKVTKHDEYLFEGVVISSVRMHRKPEVKLL
ncbi:LexA family protein [Pseudoalteromonas lipolytica]|uniref:LexA family protein n=1 Tax=Pseudoalteromonas lipolytica TaxID=570156 RepID=UPI000C41C7F5|nr:S24 family peptidase [Pseudoalteromonas lipolytica]MAE02319.1 DNA polymerase V [Pseudoalteromonas sp.]|tara:strand:+ start:1682 stop:2062 length:381 start_codon:yes stop_codon:yes gene_type:complete